MPEWIDFAVYVAFTVVAWGWLSTATSRTMMVMIGDRDPGWMTSHPDAPQQLAWIGWPTRFCLLWGGLSLAALGAFHAGMWPQFLAWAPDAPKWERLKDLHALLLVAGLLLLAGHAAFFVRWLHPNVPLAARRQATLAPRSIRDHVPVAFQCGTYGLVILHLGLWVIVGLTGRYATPAFWATMAFQFAVAGVFLSFVLMAVRRRPGAIDRTFGPGYRRLEVRVAFAAQVLPLLNGAARLYEHVANVRVESVDRSLQLSLVVLILTLLALDAFRARNTARQSSDPIGSGSS